MIFNVADGCMIVHIVHICPPFLLSQTYPPDGRRDIRLREHGALSSEFPAYFTA